ncbi:MAG TPA: DNA polymerase ligase N-terminal domain-containing protein [Thermoanaerobaculia bacterium]
MAERELLKKYRAMRDFGDTPEPAGSKLKGKQKLPIFVIQKHAASHLHYDFRLEMEGVLKSWAVPKGPSYDPGVRRLAMMTEDHPYDYASFEGVIPAGNYGAGNVIIWDNGTWEFIEPGDDPVKALKSGKLTFRMFGKKMFGEWALVRIKGKGSSDRGNEWLLLKHRDEFANEAVDVTAVAPRSVVSQKLVEEMGGEKIWISNRAASGAKGRPTMAARLEREQQAAAPPAKKTSAKKVSVKKATPAKKGTSAKKAAPAKKAAYTKKAAPVKKTTSTKRTSSAPAKKKPPAKKK